MAVAEVLCDKETLLLLSLPNEIIIQILSFLSTADLLSVECTCTLLNKLAVDAYSSAYGPEPFHRSSIGSPDYRALAIEQLKYLINLTTYSENKWSVGDTLKQLHSDAYLFTDEEYGDYAKHELFELQASDERDTAQWNEAVATALMAQGRHSEAGSYYKNILQEPSLPECTLLTAARCGWPFEFPYQQTTSPDLLSQAFLGAAASGNLDLLIHLHEGGIPLDLKIGHNSAASTAARMGNIKILEYLHEKNVDILAEGRYSALGEASKCGHVTTIKFLFSVGGNPNERVFDDAVSMAQVDTLRLFIQHNSDLATTYAPDGRLRLETIICPDSLSRQEINAIVDFFVKEVHLDINAVKPDGRAAIHLAAEAGNANIIESLISHGAELSSVDRRGMSPLEIAWSWKHEAIMALLGGRFIGDEKFAHAAATVKSFSAMSIRLIASFHSDRIQGNSIEEKEKVLKAKWIAADMDNMIAEIWFSSYSATALKAYAESILGSRTDHLWSQIVIAIAVARTSTTDAPELDDKMRLLGALEIAQTVEPRDERPNTLALHIAHALSIVDLQEMLAYLNSDLGIMMTAGRFASRERENKTITKFLGDIGLLHN